MNIYLNVPAQALSELNHIFYYFPYHKSLRSYDTQVRRLFKFICRLCRRKFYCLDVFRRNHGFSLINTNRFDIKERLRVRQFPLTLSPKLKYNFHGKPRTYVTLRGLRDTGERKLGRLLFNYDFS